MIDILLATYNSELFLAEQLDSIIAQDCSNWRLIVRDGGSTDKTLVKLQEYQQKLGSEKFIIIGNNEPSSALDNFCELLTHTRSEYIMFCDHDDVWLKNKISLSLNHIQKISNQNQPVLVFTDKKIVDENLNILAESFFYYLRLNPYKLQLNNLITQNVASGCTMLFNRELLQLLNIEMMQKYAVMHDHWIVLVAQLFGKISYLNKPTMLYRQHSKNVYGATKLKNKLKKVQFIRNKFYLDCYQCEGLLVNYNQKIKKKTNITLREFANLPKMNYFKRRYILFKYKIFKHGFGRTASALLLI